MIKVLSTLALLFAVAFAFPFPEETVSTAQVSTTLATPAAAVPVAGPSDQPPLPGCIPIPAGPPPSGPPPPADPNAPPPPGPPLGPDGKPLPWCPPTVVSGHCGGKTYFWDTAKESEPEEFKTCFNADGPVTAVCNGKEYTWDPAKDSKPKDLEECEKTIAAAKQLPTAQVGLAPL